MPELKERSLTEHLRYENQQFHFDALSGMIHNTLSFIAHQPRIRKELRAGTRRLQDSAPDNKALSAFGVLYQNKEPD